MNSTVAHPAGTAERLTQYLDPDVLESAMEKVRRSTGVPGICVTLATGQTVTTACIGEHTAGEGAPILPSSRFQTGCVLHLLTNMLALKLAAIGQLTLDATISSYLRELSGGPVGDVPIRDLLRHTSGFQLPGRGAFENHAVDSWQGLARYLVTAPLRFAPGKVFNYSVYDHLILERILKTLTGMELLEALRTQILDPLNLVTGTPEEDSRLPFTYVRSHSYDSVRKKYTGRAEDTAMQDPQDGPQITMTTETLAALASQLAQWSGDASGGLESWQVFAGRLLTREEVKVPRADQPVWQQQVPVSYGLGCARYADGFFGCPGSTTGQCCAFLFDPQRRIVVAIGLNARARWVRDGIAANLCRLVGTRTSLPPAPPHTPVRRSDPKDLEGRYVRAESDIYIAVEAETEHLNVSVIDPIIKESTNLRLPLSRSDGHDTRERTKLRIPISFFQEPDTGVPCLMYGWHAYKRL